MPISCCRPPPGSSRNPIAITGASLRLREKLIEPIGEARSNFDILAELADRLGYGDVFFQDRKALLEYILGESGFTLEDFDGR